MNCGPVTPRREPTVCGMQRNAARVSVHAAPCRHRTDCLPCVSDHCSLQKFDTGAEQTNMAGRTRRVRRVLLIIALVALVVDALLIIYLDRIVTPQFEGGAGRCLRRCTHSRSSSMPAWRSPRTRSNRNSFVCITPRLLCSSGREPTTGAARASMSPPAGCSSLKRFARPDHQRADRQGASRALAATVMAHETPALPTRSTADWQHLSDSRRGPNRRRAPRRAAPPADALK